MIKPEQVPEEVMNALLQALRLRKGGKEAIAAALNAWQGMYTDDETMYGKVIGKTIFLPLTENSDD